MTSPAKPHFDIALILLWRDGRLLVTRRRRDTDHLPDVWEFPGGKCEAGEKPTDAAVREAREELGVEVEATGARSPICFDYEARSVTLRPFDCRLLSGEPQALQSSELRWLRPDELRAEEFPAANQSLIEELRRQLGQDVSGQS